MRGQPCSLLLTILTLLLLPLSAAAETTGQLQGAVVDEHGAPLAGVSVSASSPAQIGGLQLTRTDERGEFRYPLLAPGDYTVRLSLDGLVTQELTEVRVRLERTTRLQVTMAEATFQDEILVAETTPVVDPEQTSAGQTFTAEYLEKSSIGMGGRNYLAVPPQAAGVEPAGYSYRIHGSRRWENSLMIDGAEASDTWEFGAVFDGIGFDAIQEVAVHTAGFGAEHGLATGGVINVVTRSGGNRFTGSVDLRYRDNDFEDSGEFYDPDEEPFERRVFSAALGGPILRDRLWFFASASDTFDSNTPINTPYSVDTDLRLLMGKLSWQASPGWSLAGRYLDENLRTDRGAGNQFRAEEATVLDEYGPSSASLELTGILSSSLVWSLQLSEFDAPFTAIPFDRDFTTIGHINYVTGERYGNAANQFYNDWGRQEVRTELSWFLPAARGSHDIQAGLRYADLDFGRNQCTNGSGRACTVGDEGFVFWDSVDVTGANRPDEMDISIASGRQGVTGSQASAWLSDAWRLRPDLTLHLGLRWDESEQQHDFGNRSIELGQLQPRLGVAWDVRGDGRNVLRASWGRYMHPSALAIGDFYLSDRVQQVEIWASCTTWLSADPGACQAFAEGNGGAYRTDPDSWDPAGWWLWNVRSQDAGGVVTPDLDPMTVDHLVLAFERELFRRTSLELSFIQKDFRDIIEDTCIGNYPVPSADADCSSFLLANLAEAQRDYQAWTLRFESRALDRLHVIASWIWADSQGNVDGFVINWDLDKFPELYENRYGYLRDHGHRIKINGFVELPWDLLLGLAGSWSSELRWTPQRPFRGFGGTIYTEPRGNRKEDGLYGLDLQLSKGIRIGRTRLQLIGTVYNALDTEQPISFCTNVTGCGDFELGEPLDWQRPRSFEIGLRVDF